MKDLYQYIKKTPIITNEELNDKLNCKIFFKCENLQVTGSFKFRGACNAILNLTESQRSKGIITVSSGNHGAALAKAGKIFNIKTHIIVPKNSSPAKIKNIKKHGAIISYCGNNVEDRKLALEQEQKKTQCHFISPYNDFKVIYGQSTVAQEILEEVVNLNAIVSPVGGGGLVSGTIISRDKINKNIEIYGAEPEGANDAFLSLNLGEIITPKKVSTICDGLRACLGDITFPIIKSGIKQIITISDQDTLNAMKIIWENLKIIVEPSSAVTLAAILKRPEIFKNKKVGVILTGGNVVLDKVL